MMYRIAMVRRHQGSQMKWHLWHLSVVAGAHRCSDNSAFWHFDFQPICYHAPCSCCTCKLRVYCKHQLTAVLSLEEHCTSTAVDAALDSKHYRGATTYNWGWCLELNGSRKWCIPHWCNSLVQLFVVLPPTDVTTPGQWLRNTSRTWVLVDAACAPLAPTDTQQYGEMSFSVPYPWNAVQRHFHGGPTCGYRLRV